MLLRINRSIKNVNGTKAVCLNCMVRLFDSMRSSTVKCILVGNGIDGCNMSV